MNWITVLKTSSVNELKTVIPTISDLKAGDQGLLKVEGLPLKTAKIFDLASVEHAFQFALPEHLKIIDVYENNSIGYVHFESKGTPLVLILAAVAAVLLSLGIVTASITLLISPKSIPEALNPLKNLIKEPLILVVVLASLTLVGLILYKYGGIK